MKKKAALKSKVPVSERALMQRINRKLAPQWQKLKKTRSQRDSDLGDYYILDLEYNSITDKNIDLEELGREFSVLRAYEKLV